MWGGKKSAASACPPKGFFMSANSARKRNKEQDGMHGCVFFVLAAWLFRLSVALVGGVGLCVWRIEGWGDG
jgi:nitrate reductase NapE component